MNIKSVNTKDNQARCSYWRLAVRRGKKKERTTEMDESTNGFANWSITIVHPTTALPNGVFVMTLSTSKSTCAKKTSTTHSKEIEIINLTSAAACYYNKSLRRVDLVEYGRTHHSSEFGVRIVCGGDFDDISRHDTQSVKTSKDGPELASWPATCFRRPGSRCKSRVYGVNLMEATPPISKKTRIENEADSDINR